MFAGIDIASERHWLARLDDAGKRIGKPVPITEDRDGHDKLLCAVYSVAKNRKPFKIATEQAREA